jgi:hypothetical protein
MSDRTQISSSNGAAPENELDVVSTERPVRAFVCDDVEWIAWLSGDSAYGTGTCGPAALHAVHFAHADTPETPAFEALLPAGRFFGLYDEELVILLRGASKVVDANERSVKTASRRGEGLL